MMLHAAAVGAHEEATAREKQLEALMLEAVQRGDAGTPAVEAAVRDARAAGLPVVLVHETDAERDGSAFDTFFKTTPQDLVNGGLYDALAELFVSGTTHRKLSRAQLAKKLGAEAGGVRKLSVAASAAAEMSFSSMRRTSKSGPAGGSGNTSPQAQRGVLDVVQQRA